MTTVTVTNVQAEPGGQLDGSRLVASAPSGASGFLCVAMIVAVAAVAVIMWFAYHDWIKPVVVKIQTAMSLSLES